MSLFRILPVKDLNNFKNTSSYSKGTNANESCVIVGGEKEKFLRSCLLFQAALSLAKDVQDRVLFVCRAPLQDKPLPVDGMSGPSTILLQCLKVIYISKADDLLQYFSEFHMKETLPAAIIIDGMDYYVSHYSHVQERETALVKLMALLEDTTAFVAQKKGEPCHRLIALTHSATSPDITKRFFKEQWRLSESDGEDEYFVTDASIPAHRAVLRVHNEGRIALQQFYRLQTEGQDSEIDE